MSRSHPPSLLRHVRTTLEKECQVRPGATIAVAVSGGPDSMALGHALSLLREELKLRLVLISIDHGLRREAQEEVELVRRASEAWGAEFLTARLDLRDGGNLQARAREARYRALFALVDENLGEQALIATAHHKDDRAETVLLRLLRGTTLEGLSVLSARSDRLIRPLIRAARADVLLHLERHQIDAAQDPSNENPRFLRVRTRTELLPLMAELGPGIIDHLAEIADEAGRLPEPLGLNREQRQQFRRALQDPDAPVDLRLPRGLTLTRPSRNKTVK